MFISQSLRSAKKMIPVFSLGQPTENPSPFDEQITHLAVSIHHNKERGCYILSIAPSTDKGNGCFSTVLNPTPGHSYYGKIKDTKRYNYNELCVMAETFDENYPINPIILNLLKYHNLSLTEPSTQENITTAITPVNTVNTVTEVTTPEPQNPTNILQFPNAISKLLTSPTVSRFLVNS